jgi:hypothetical protein
MYKKSSSSIFSISAEAEMRIWQHLAPSRKQRSCTPNWESAYIAVVASKMFRVNIKQVKICMEQPQKVHLKLK